MAEVVLVSCLLEKLYMKLFKLVHDHDIASDSVYTGKASLFIWNEEESYLGRIRDSMFWFSPALDNVEYFIIYLKKIKNFATWLAH